MFWIGLLVIIIVLGALSGGQSFGETVANGVGCIVMAAVGLFVLAVIFG